MNVGAVEVSQTTASPSTTTQGVNNPAVPPSTTQGVSNPVVPSPEDYFWDSGYGRYRFAAVATDDGVCSEVGT